MLRVITTTIICFFSVLCFTQVCWNSLSYDTCEYRILTEASFFRTINFSEDPINIELGLGIQKNLTDKYGIGMLVFYDFRDINGIGLRFSRLINPDLELQFTPKLYYRSSGNDDLNTPGFAFETGINWKNFLGLYLKTETIDGQKDGKPVISWGIKANGPSSSIVGILSIVGIAILFIALK